jgi:hypothetical protein
MSVVVYILAQRTDSPRTAAVERLFENELFNVNVVNIKVPCTVASGLEANQVNHFAEFYRMMWCLKDSQSRFPNLPVIIIKDTSVSNNDADTIAEVISEVTNRQDWHLCYLCKWADRCDLYTKKETLPGRGTIIAKTQAPHGVQAIMFSPQGRDLIACDPSGKNVSPGAIISPNQSVDHSLHQAITSGRLNAVAVVPNLIDFDINAARNNKDYLKTAQCMVPSDNIQNNTKTATVSQDNKWSWLWVIIAIIIVVLLGWAIIKMFQKNTTQVTEEVYNVDLLGI